MTRKNLSHSMAVKLLPIDSIRPYENNPRLNDAAVEAVAQSIKEYGFRQPMVTDPQRIIICGHTRYRAALKLGLKKVPVHIAHDLTPEQIKAYRIADNKTADLSDWNYELLPIELGELQAMNYDLDLLGFDQDELDRLLHPGGKPGLCDPDDIPAPPDAATTQPGDVWILGTHRSKIMKQQFVRVSILVETWLIDIEGAPFARCSVKESFPIGPSVGRIGEAEPWVGCV